MEVFVNLFGYNPNTTANFGSLERDIMEDNILAEALNDLSVCLTENVEAFSDDGTPINWRLLVADQLKLIANNLIERSLSNRES